MIYINYIVIVLAVALMIAGMMGIVNRRLPLDKYRPKKKISLFKGISWFKEEPPLNDNAVEHKYLVVYGLPAILVGISFLTSGVLLLDRIIILLNTSKPLESIPILEVLIFLIAYTLGNLVAKYQRAKKKFYQVVNDKEVQKQVLKKIAETQTMIDEEKKHENKIL